MIGADNRMVDFSGRTIGRYRFEELLGSGGVGQVYRATSAHLNEPVAVKVIFPGLAPDLGSSLRFIRLARRLAGIDHPHIVKVFDNDVLEDLFFLVMELMPDGSVRDLWEGLTDSHQGHSLASGVNLVRQAAEGLAHAHSQGIIHGDVKPDNLLLRRTAPPSQSYVVRVSDFGIARLWEETAESLDDNILATPAYMSPEQCQGGQADASSDQYSLGVVLYEAVTGFVPFEVRSLEDAVYKHCYAQPPPPHATVPDLPPALEEVILRCLAKRPEDRYPSMAEVADRLTDVDAAMPEAVGTGVVVVHEHLPIEQRTTASLPPDSAAVRPPDSSLPVPDPARTVPQLHVIDASGALRESKDLTARGLTVGRAAGCDVVLEDLVVSRHHLRLDWDGKNATVTPDETRNGAFLAGGQLVPEAAQAIRQSSWLQVGRNYLWLELPPRAITAPRDESSRIHLTLDRAVLTIVPGQMTQLALTLANRGRVVDHFLIKVKDEETGKDLVGSWVEVPDDTVELNPGTHAVLLLTVLVPRSSENLARTYSVAVRAESELHPSEAGVALATWKVLPYYHHTLEFAYPRQTVWNSRPAEYTLTLCNEGNSPDRYVLRGDDEENLLQYDFNPRTDIARALRLVKSRDAVEMTRGPGEGKPASPLVSPVATSGLWGVTWLHFPSRRARTEEKSVDPTAILLQVYGRWRLVGRKHDFPFSVDATSTSDGSVQTVKGVLSQRALIPVWIPPLAWLLLAFVVVWAYMHTQPQVVEFVVAPKTILPTGKAFLHYEVINAQRVAIHPHPVNAQVLEPSPIEIDPPKSPYRAVIVVTPLKAQATSYQIHASNWCIGQLICLHPDAIGESQTLDVPPLPTRTSVPTSAPRPVPPVAIPKPTRPPVIIPPIPTTAPPAVPAAPIVPPKKGAHHPKPTPKPAAAHHPKPRPTAAHHPKPTSKAKPTVSHHARPTPAPRPKPTGPPTRRLTPIPFLPRIKPYLGTWVNIVTNPEQYSLISLTITEVNARTLSFHGYFSCAEGTCDGGTTRVPLGGKNKSAPLKARFKVEKVQVEIRIQGVLRRLLHVRLIERVSDCTMCPARNEYLLHPTGQSGPAITPIPSTAPVYSSGG